MLMNNMLHDEPGKQSDEDDVMLDVNTTPLIDVMLVLLIMLIVTIPMQTHAVKLDMPDTTALGLDEPPPVVTVEVDFDGTVIWDGNMLADRAALEERLEKVANTTVNMELHIRPNRLVEYGHVAMVLATAQRVGVTKIGIVGNEQYMPE